MQLVSLLREDGFQLSAPQIVARTGWTTGDLLEQLRATKPAGPFSLVSLQIGANNQYRGLDEEQYSAELAQLLDLAAEYSGDRPERVLVLSIPDWGVTPFAAKRDRQAIAADIDDLNTRKRRQAESRGFQFIDVTPLSRLAASDPELIAKDGLHPSAAMYQRWCLLAIDAARRALSP